MKKLCTKYGLIIATLLIFLSIKSEAQTLIPVELLPNSKDGQTGSVDHYNYPNCIVPYDGTMKIGDETGIGHYWRAWAEFNLPTYNDAVWIDHVDIKLYVTTAGSSGHLLDIHRWYESAPYLPSDYWWWAQTNPSNGQYLWNYTANGTTYVNDNTSLRSTGWKTISLGTTAKVHLSDLIESVKYFV